MVLVVIRCATCNNTAGTGLDGNHAETNIAESGGRIIAGQVRVCGRCARGTR